MRLWTALATVSILLTSVVSAPLDAQDQNQTFMAIATVNSPAGTVATLPVNVVIQRTTTEAERTAVADALKKSGTPGVVAVLKTMPDIGYIDVGGRETPVKYAYSRAVGGGRLLTVIAPTPVLYLGSGMPDLAPKEGFDLSMVVLELRADGGGSGEFLPVGKAKLDASGAIQTEDAGSTTMMLTGVRATQ